MPAPRCPNRIVTTADAVLSARYSFETQKDGHFWIGKTLVRVGGGAFFGESLARSPERAIAMALREVADDMLRHHPQVYEEDG